MNPSAPPRPAPARPLVAFTLTPLAVVAVVAVVVSSLPAADAPADIDKRPALVVWEGAKPTGKTWAQPGPRGTVDTADGAGFAPGKSAGKGLVVALTGSGWRGGGLNWKGWYPPDAGDDVSGRTTLVFHIRQHTNVPTADLTVNLVDNVKRPTGTAASNGVRIVAGGFADKLDGRWRRVVIPLRAFADGKPLRLDRLWEIDFSDTDGGDLTFHIDRIGFGTDPVAAPRFDPAGSFQANVRVDADQPGHRINDGIYGVCGLPRAKLVEFGIPLTRWGGNPATRYNWKLNVDNGANDWFFKNRGARISDLENTGYLTHIKANRAHGATTYQTVPMIGWVAKDDSSYGFSVKKYGRQRAAEPGHVDVGNGVRPDGTPVTRNDPRDSSVEAGPEFVAEAVRFVVSKAGPADRGGVRYWVLDNEPALWNSTHRDVHPEPLGYDELWDRTVKYAEAIKREDPTAKVAGFCSWGWMDLFYSARDGADNFRTKPDWQAHGKVPFAAWFIRRCGEYKKRHGSPLIDVFDVHWYPQASANGQGPYLGKGFDPALNELRLRTTRDLWDPAYQQESWIRATDPSPVALFGRVKAWIEANNPGMELCLGEYNFGGGDNITGGLAQADVFGILARERVDLAFIWHTPEGTQNLAWQLYRSYDGKGGRFGDHSLAATSDQPNVAVHAARRAEDKALTVILVNKDLHRSCDVTLAGVRTGTRAAAWRFDQDSGDAVRPVKEKLEPTAGKLKLKLPAASATLVVIPGT